MIMFYIVQKLMFIVMSWAYSVIEVTCYFGWLHVAEEIIDPFGDDEMDFDINGIVDRNIEAVMLSSDCLMHSRSLEKCGHKKTFLENQPSHVEPSLLE